MIVNLTSADESTNYELIGGTIEPESPNINTLWVNTPHPITGHVFSHTLPDDPYEGLLCIVTGVNEHSDSFSVSKLRDVIVYPMKAEQYIDNKWQSVLIKRYTEEGYITVWTGDLLYSAVTGGIELNAADANNSQIRLSGNTISINPTQSTILYGRVNVKNYIDLTGWNSIKTEVRLSGSVTTANCTLSISRYEGTANTTIASKSVVISPDIGYQATITLDISEITGEHRINLTVSNKQATSSSFAVTINSLTLL